MEHIEADQDGCTALRGKHTSPQHVFAPELSLFNQKLHDAWRPNTRIVLRSLLSI